MLWCSLEQERGYNLDRMLQALVLLVWFVGELLCLLKLLWPVNRSHHMCQVVVLKFDVTSHAVLRFIRPCWA